MYSGYVVKPAVVVRGDDQIVSFQRGLADQGASMAMPKACMQGMALEQLPPERTGELTKPFTNDDETEPELP